MRDLHVSFPSPCAERWDEMRPSGCDRVCARCDSVVHDLSHYAFEAAEALLRSNPDACVRARVDRDGVVALKHGGGRGARRMILAVGASIGLFAAQGPALAQQEQREGSIAGKITSMDGVEVTARAADGLTYRARVRKDGRYRFEGVLPGRYTLTFVPDCGDSWTIETVVMEGGVASVPDTANPNGCIVIGSFRIAHDTG